MKLHTEEIGTFIQTSSCVFLFQFLIVVVDSTDRERLAVTKAELYNMLNHEVRTWEKLYVYESQQYLWREFNFCC